MAGNVNNWVQDVFWLGFGAHCLAAGRLADPVLDPDLAASLGVPVSRRVDRGGGFLTSAGCLEVLSCSHPLGWDPGARELWHGLRTAADGEA